MASMPVQAVPWALRLAPPFPSVAQRIIATVSREDSALSDVGALVKRDPSFSADLLRFANSAMFRVRQEVRSIPHALMLVGADRVKAMAVLVVLNRMVQPALRIESLRKVWLHSLATALVAEQAGRAFRVPKDTAYTIGLLHNLGTLCLMASHPEAYNRMIEVSDEFGFDLLQTEHDLFDIDHCDAGEYLAREWCFPDLLVSAISTHHADPVEGERSAANLARISWRVADTLGHAAFARDREWSYDELMAFVPEAANDWLKDEPEAVANELSERLSQAPF